MEDYNMRFKSIAIALLASASLLFSGCAARVQHVTGTPAGVNETQVKDWYGVVGALHQVSSANHSAFLVVTGFRDAGVWPDEGSYVAVLQDLGRIDVLELQADGLLQQQPNQWNQPLQAQVKSMLEEMLTKLADIPTQQAVGVKDAEKQQKLVTELDALKVSIELVNSFINIGNNAVVTGTTAKQ
jgi:hypothetical protein